MSILKQGSKGDEVKTFQEKLKQLGFSVESDGIFGTKTHAAVITLQTVFGYDIDGDVGPATQKLIDQQVGYGWNLAAARAARGAAATRMCAQEVLARDIGSHRIHSRFSASRVCVSHGL
jgi:peptidoglycan hydrolase-like protein with peptidoglycan-binding domain